MRLKIFKKIRNFRLREKLRFLMKTKCVNFRSSRSEVFLRKGVLKICSSFIGEIALWHACSPVNLLHIFRKSFPKKTSGRLYLHTDPFSDRSITFITVFGSSHRRCSIRKGVLRNFAKFTEKTCARVTF